MLLRPNSWIHVALPSQSNGQGGGEDNHIAQSSGRGRGGSSCPHKTDSAVLPSEEKGRESGWENFLGGERKFNKDYLHYIIITLLLTNIQKIKDLSDKEKCC